METALLEPERIDAAGECYVPSGRVEWGHFAPLVVMAIGVTGAMGYVLALLIRRSAENVVPTLVNSVPVLAAIVVAVYVGRCRSRALALLLAVGLIVIYYVGAWVAAHALDVRDFGPGVNQFIKESTGLPVLLGYFVIRNDPSGGSFDRPWVTGMLVASHVMEFAVLLAAAVYGARWFVGRAFYESHRRWATSWMCGFDRRDLPRVENAIAQRDWEALEHTERTPLTRETRRRGAMILRIEYLPRGGDQQVYVTIEGPRLWRLGEWLGYLPVLHRFTRKWMTQRTIGPEDARELSRRLPGLEIASPDESLPERTSGGIRYWSGGAQGPTAGGDGLVSVLREQGLVGVTLVGKGEDFRSPAAAATAAATFGASVVDIDSIDSSLCIAAEPSPLKTLKKLAWVELGVTAGFLAGASLSFFVIWSGNALGAAGHEQLAGAMAFVSIVIAALGVGLAIIAAPMFRPLQMFLLARHFKRRGGSAIALDGSGARRELVRIEDPATFHVSKLTPEDWGLLVLEEKMGRMIIEGVSHRYVVRGQDVIEVVPLKGTGANARVTYRVGEQSLGLVINLYRARTFWLGVWAALPLLGLPARPLARHAAEKWAKRMSDVFARGSAPLAG